MIGLIIVSHSHKIAEGVAELAAQMAPDVRIIPAGGMDDNGIGTSFDKVMAAVDTLDSVDHIVILYDLGSALLTTETVVDFLDASTRSRIHVLDAPLVEGSVAAAVAAQTGAPIADITDPRIELDTATDDTLTVTADVILTNTHGLHARPAAEFVKLAAGFASAITINGGNAKSLLAILALGLTQGAAATITATGPDAATAISQLVALTGSGFGEG